MNEKQLRAAERAMSEWLAHPKELGKAPARIECAGEFELHGLRYYIFKFKKALLGKWLLRVCGGYEGDSTEHCGHVFSSMTEYSPETAEQDSIEIVEAIRGYWQKQAENGQVQSGGADGASGGFVSFVLLSDKSWSAKQLISDLRSDWSIDAEKDGEKSDDSLVFSVDGMTAMASLIPAPVPNGEAADNAQSNYLWKGAVEAAGSHKAHLIVGVIGKETDPMERGKLLVKLVSCCCKQKETIGVYTNGTVFEPRLYCGFAEMMKKDEIPLFNLVWFGLYRSENGSNGASGYTNGLSAFGKDEMEILDSSRQPSDIRDFLTEITAYVLENDVTLKDGETIGLTEDDKHLITRSKGVAVPGMTLKIEY